MHEVILSKSLSRILIVLLCLLNASCNSSTNKSVKSASNKTIGHISSFFKQSERPSPIIDYVDNQTNQIKIDDIYPNLLQLKSNYFSFGFWATEDRTIYAWGNFIKLLSQLQKDRPDISLYIYVGSPEYAKEKSFCWDELPTNEQCQQKSNYDNYIRWAEKVATLNKKFPIVKGLLIDDFIYSLSTDDSDSKIFTSAYLDQIRGRGKGIYPDFRLETVWYLPAITAYHAKRVSGHLDSVHFFYRHYNATRFDDNPDRIANEIEMFSRAFSPSVSPLISVFRQLNKPASEGNKVIVKGLINISEVNNDLSIAYWDNKYTPKRSTLHGWTKIKLYFENQLLLEQDIMDGVSDNEIQVFKVPYEIINNFQNMGHIEAQLRLEIITLKSYLHWGYATNLFILSPENTPVNWSTNDEENSHFIVTSNDLPAPIDRYIGLYAGPHSAFDITPEYTKTVLARSQKALDENKIEGIISWEIMMNPSNSQIFSLYKNFYLDNEK